MAVEEHGAGKQLVRGKTAWFLGPLATTVLLVLVLLAFMAGRDLAYIATLTLAAAAGVLARAMLIDLRHANIAFAKANELCASNVDR